MTAPGLDAKTMQVLKPVFARYPCIKQIKLYGSRAKGSFHARSDIDLVAIGENIDRFAIAAIFMDLDDSDIPYIVDLQNYSELKNRRLIEHIDRVGMVIYDRQTDTEQAIGLCA
jgi:predicted nucleotidyltransferase